MSRRKKSKKSDNEGTHFRGYAMRTGTPILPASGPARVAALLNDGQNRLAQSYRQYGEALAILGWSILGDINLIPKQNFKARPYILGRADNSPAWEDLQRKLATSSDENLRQIIESKFRGALSSAIDAFNFMEELDSYKNLAESAHVQAHRCAELIGNIFGCQAEIEDGRYWIVCPLRLMHFRMGLSVGLRTVRVCSLCGNPIDECEHLLDEEYEIVVKRDSSGACSACGTNSCSHIAGDVVRLYPRPIHGDIELDEVSWVSTPRDPLARTTGIRIGKEQIKELAGGHPVGSPLNCGYCTGPCSGFNYPLDQF